MKKETASTDKSAIKLFKFIMSKYIQIIVIVTLVSLVLRVSGELYKIHKEENIKNAIDSSNSDLAQNYKEYYEYSSEDKDIVTYQDVSRSFDVFDIGLIDVNYAKSTQNLIERLNSNGVETVCRTEPSNAIKVISSSVEVDRDTLTAFINLEIQSILPIVINDLRFIAVAHSGSNVYFDVPITLKNLELNAYGTYELSLAKDISKFSELVPSEFEVSLVDGYIR